MLILGQRNDDSLARDVDWFGSSERSEISPASIWVPDEDETIRQRRVTTHRPPVVEEDFDYYWSLHEISPQVSVSDEDSLAEDSLAKPRTLPEINPHVSVRDEDSFAKPSPLPEINPHVSVRDEDSFAKPSPLPEINPHVSVRDEDSFAKPSPLPEIHPHVSVRDEDSFAKPIAVPEIHPEISTLDELQVSELSGQFSSGVCGLDDSRIQPGEPSFVSVSIDGGNEKRFIQEYMELGPSLSTELESNHPSEFESSVLTEPESSRLTEPQSNRPSEFESSGLTEPESTRLTEPQPNRPSEMESGRSAEPQSGGPVASPRVRVLDESQVLPGEASFATAIPSGEFAPGSHSPLQEFLAKTNLDLRTFMLASLLFVSIIGISALVIMEATTGVFSSQFVASAAAGGTSPKVGTATPQSQVIETTTPAPPIAMSKLSKQESQTMAPPREYPKFPQEATKPMSLEGSSDVSRNAHSNDIRAEKSDRPSAGKASSRETSNREGAKNATSAKSVHANTKDTADRKKTSESVSRHSASSHKRTAVNKSNSKARERKPASATAKNATITKPKAETKVPSASNGAQRPRTVTPRKTS